MQQDTGQESLLKTTRETGISKTRCWIEITLVVLTGVNEFLFVDYLKIKGPFVVTALLFWVGYILVIGIKNKMWDQWGFRKKGFRKSFTYLLWPALILTGIFLIYGIVQDTALFSRTILLTMILYPIWGLIQQFLMMSLIAGNLRILSNNKMKTLSVSLITALVFASVHLPTIPLAGATFVLALVYSYIFLQHRNLFPLGLFHGWLGCFFYYFVLGRDAWNEFIEKFSEFLG